MRKFNVILCTDLNGGIGYKNDIPWKFKLDQDHFRFLTETTQNNIFAHSSILIMGKNTWISLNRKTLKNRISYVVTSDKSLEKFENTLFFENFYVALVHANAQNGKLWVIGGSSIYDQALRHFLCDKIYLTIIDNVFETDVKINLKQYNINWYDSVEKTDINKLDSIEYKLKFLVGTVQPGVEAQYLKMINSVIRNGEKRMTRNGITYSLFSTSMTFDLKDGFPLLTTKKMFWKGIVEELLFFIRGNTQSMELEEKGIKIWNMNTSREFLDTNGKHIYDVGEMGPMYGFQWRNFNGTHRVDKNNCVGIDQLSKVINELKKDPHSRRILMTAFNPLQTELGVLYPCHSIVLQFYVEKSCLSCNMYQRSGDCFLGVPFNIASTSLLVHIIAKIVGYSVGKVTIMLGDYHVYEEHVESVLKQLSRTGFNLPVLKMKDFDSVEQVEKMNWKDFVLEEYICCPAISSKMIA